VLHIACSVLGLLGIAIAVGLLLIPAAGLLTASVELVLVGYLLEDGQPRLRARR
jgi:hypothetical protein